MKKLLIALAVGGAIFGTVFAFAATLNVSSNELGAGDANVASCDSDVTTGYTVAYDATSGYVVDKVSVTNIDATACADATVYVTISDGTHTESTSGTIAAAAAGFDIPNTVVAKLVGTNNIHVAITKP